MGIDVTNISKLLTLMKQKKVKRLKLAEMELELSDAAFQTRSKRMKNPILATSPAMADAFRSDDEDLLFWSSRTGTDSQIPPPKD